VDSTGASVAGAVLTLRCPARPPAVIRTGADGSFRFVALPAAGCRLEVRRKGFRVVKRVVGAASSPLRITLAVAPMHQQVTVSGAPAQVQVEPAGNVDTVEVNSEMLNALPILDQDFLGAAAGFLDEGLTGSSGYRLVVDGVETDGLGVSPSAIKEIRINKNPYSAEYYRPGHGRIEVVTQQGTPRFHGSLSLLARGYPLIARNAFAATRQHEYRRTVEGHLAGPLARSGKTFFLLTGEYVRDDDWPVIYARTPGQLLTGRVRQPDREKEMSFRLSRIINEAQRYSLQYDYDGESSRNQDVGGFNLPETAADGFEDEHEVRFNHQAVIANRWLNQLWFRLRRKTEQTRSRVHGIPRIVVSDAFVAGSAQQDELEGRNGFELTDVISVARGKHSVRAGVDLNDIDRRSWNDLRDRDGTFYFSSIEDYLAGRPYSFVRQAGDGRVVFWTGNPAVFLQDDWRLRDNLSLGFGLRWERWAWPGGRGSLAPRFSMAWAPGRGRRTVLRAGGGVFHDGLDSSEPRDVLLFDGGHLSRFLLTDPSYPEVPTLDGATALPSSVVRFSPELQTPVLWNYSLGVERQLWAKTTLAITYAGIQGRRLYRSRDRNAPVPPGFERPNPALGIVREIESGGRLASHSLEVTFRGNLTRLFNGGIVYRVGRAMNDTDGADWIPPNSLDLSREWARAGYDRRHRLRAYGAIQIPKLFDLGLVLSVSSGRPYSLTTGRDDNHDGRGDDRPPGVRRNSLNGPANATLDLRWSKQLSLPFAGTADRRPKLRLAVDAFNALNHVNYTRMVGNLSSPFFGKPVAAAAARRFQLSLRVQF